MAVSGPGGEAVHVFTASMTDHGMVDNFLKEEIDMTDKNENIESGESLTAKEIIAKGHWADCKICEEAFRRRRQTKRYCSVCGFGFCEGEHGTFAGGRARCVICGRNRSIWP